MKNLFSLTVSLVLCNVIFAQTPQSFSYQAIARNASGDILQNHSISLRISILKTSVSGIVVYGETHSVSTNSMGLFNLEIGNGIPANGVFEEIDWASNRHFLKVEMDAAGGTNFTLMGISELLSVPYALYAEKSGGIKVDSTTSCNALTEGNIRYNKITKELQFCDGTQWVNLASSSNTGQTDSASYRIISQDIAIVTEEVYDIFIRSIIEDNGAKLNDPCVTANVTPLINYPRTLTLDFGSSPCLCLDGKYRSGSISAIFSGPIRTDGTGVTLSFNTYKVDTLTISGTMSIQNTGSVGNTILTATISNMMFSATSGTMTLNGSASFEWTAGKTTINDINDDIFSVTGNFSGTSFKGKSFTASITEALELKASCVEIVEGELNIQPSGMSEIDIDFGNGTCDGVAEMTTEIAVTILGQTYYYPYTTTINLP